MSGGGLGDFTSMRDMVDGAGPGASGADFEGGPLSDILNRLGVEPMGSKQPVQKPVQQPMQMPEQRMQGYAPEPVSVSPLPKQQMPNYGPPSASSGGYERLSDQELIQLARRAGII